MIRSAWYPDGRPAPAWGVRVVDLFRRHEAEICSKPGQPIAASEQVLEHLAGDLVQAGFVIERRKLAAPPLNSKLDPPFHRDQIDIFHPQWLCCLSIEGRRTKSDAHDALIEPLLVVDMDTLCLAVPNIGDPEHPEMQSFDSATELALTVYGHARVKLPYGLLLIGF